jgi:hypothetical protein
LRATPDPVRGSVAICLIWNGGIMEEWNGEK